MLNYIVDFTGGFANRLVAEINAELPAEQATHISIEDDGTGCLTTAT